MSFQPPIIGAWYRDLEQDQLFEAVAMDDSRGTVEVQYLDGAIDNFDLETWAQLPLARAPAPEDFGAAYELSPEDRWYDDQVMISQPYMDPLALIEPESLLDLDSY